MTLWQYLCSNPLKELRDCFSSSMITALINGRDLRKKVFRFELIIAKITFYRNEQN